MSNLCNSKNYSLPDVCSWNSPSKNTGVGSNSFSRRASSPRDQTQVSCFLKADSLSSEPPGKPVYFIHSIINVSMSISIYQFISPSFPLDFHAFFFPSVHLCLPFCFVNEITYTSCFFRDLVGKMQVRKKWSSICKKLIKGKLTNSVKLEFYSQQNYFSKVKAK